MTRTFQNSESTPGADSWGERFPPEFRLHDGRDYQPVFDRGAFAADDRIVVLALPNQLNVSRLGVVVSRKAGNSVVRHRWKRVIREAFRKSRQHLPMGFDLVVKPKRDAACDGVAIQRGFESLVRRAIKRMASQASSKTPSKTPSQTREGKR